MKSQRVYARPLVFLSLCLLAVFFPPTFPLMAASAAREPTKLDITITTANNVNPTEQKKAAPIEIRIYELKSNQIFDSADYFSLQNKDKETLGGDLIAKETFILRPGETQEIIRESDPETTAIGVLAGYRELDKSVWRATFKLPEAPKAAWYRMMLPSNKAELRITAEEFGLRIVPVK